MFGSCSDRRGGDRRGSQGLDGRSPDRPNRSPDRLNRSPDRATFPDERSEREEGGASCRALLPPGWEVGGLGGAL